MVQISGSNGQICDGQLRGRVTGSSGGSSSGPADVQGNREDAHGAAGRGNWMACMLFALSLLLIAVVSADVGNMSFFATVAPETKSKVKTASSRVPTTFNYSSPIQYQEQVTAVQVALMVSGVKARERGAVTNKHRCRCPPRAAPVHLRVVVPSSPPHHSPRRTLLPSPPLLSGRKAPRAKPSNSLPCPRSARQV